MDKLIVNTPNAPKAIGPYSQAVGVGSLLFLSGQIAIDPISGNLVGGGVSEQTDRIMNNMKAILDAAGLTMAHLVKTTIYLQSMDDYPLVNEVYAKYFEEAPPARAAVEVAGLPLGVAVEIEGIAAIPPEG